MTATFRPTFNRVLSILIWALCGIVFGSAAMYESTRLNLGAIACVTAAIALLVWALLWQPSVSVDDQGVTVRNILRTVFVPWKALIHVDTRFALTLHTPTRLVRATAAPAPGAMGSLRASKSAIKRAQDARIQPVRPGDLPNTNSGAAAAMVLDRWERLREAGAIEAGVADHTPVPQRPNLGVIVAIAAAIVLVAVPLIIR